MYIISVAQEKFLSFSLDNKGFSTGTRGRETTKKLQYPATYTFYSVLKNYHQCILIFLMEEIEYNIYILTNTWAIYHF
jgi:hypothetical protein